MPGLEELKIGNYALVVDMLGTAARMSDPAQWPGALNEMLTALDDVFNDATDISDPDKSQAVYQYGDTFVFPSDDPARLIAIGCRLLSLWWERGILVQAGLGGGGVFYAPEMPSRVGKPIPKTFTAQLLVGPAVARGHLGMKGLKGPRFVVDAEFSTPPPSGRWTYHIGKQAFSRDAAQGIVVKEIAWWATSLADLQARIDERVSEVDAAIARSKRDMKGSPVLPLWQRDIDSLEKRKQHLLTFRECLADG